MATWQRTITHIATSNYCNSKRSFGLTSDCNANALVLYLTFRVQEVGLAPLLGFSWGYVYFMLVKPRDFRNLPVCREGTYTRAVAGGQHVSLVSNHGVTLATTTPRRPCRDRQLYSSLLVAQQT